MTAAQKAQHRELYNQLRLAIVLPGETVAGVTKPYAPVDKWSLTWDELMVCPDTPAVAHLRCYEKTMFLRMGKFI